jgi:uncharacterized protein YggE
MPMCRPRLSLIAFFSLCVAATLAKKEGHPSQTKSLPKADPAAVRTAMPASVKIVADGLNFPTSVELDDQDSAKAVPPTVRLSDRTTKAG